MPRSFVCMRLRMLAFTASPPPAACRRKSAISRSASVAAASSSRVEDRADQRDMVAGRLGQPGAALVAEPEAAAVGLQRRGQPRGERVVGGAAPSPRRAPCRPRERRSRRCRAPPHAWRAPSPGSRAAASRVTKRAAERARMISTPRRASSTRSQSAACSGAISRPARGRTETSPSQASRWIASRTGRAAKPTASRSARARW